MSRAVALGLRVHDAGLSHREVPELIVTRPRSVGDLFRWFEDRVRRDPAVARCVGEPLETL